jgi:hypothetical protein
MSSIFASKYDTSFLAGMLAKTCYRAHAYMHGCQMHACIHAQLSEGVMGGIDIVRYHAEGSMKLNARILLLAHMVYY